MGEWTEDIIEAQETAMIIRQCSNTYTFWLRQTTFKENEAWFVEQHNLINEGSAKPRTLHNWKKVLHKDSAALSIPTQADHLIQALTNEYPDVVQWRVEVVT